MPDRIDTTELRGLLERARESRHLASLSIPGEPAYELHGPEARAVKAALERAAVQALPALLDEVDRLREALERVASSCKLAKDALGNSSHQFNSVRSGFGIIEERARTALTNGGSDA